MFGIRLKRFRRSHRHGALHNPHLPAGRAGFPLAFARQGEQVRVEGYSRTVGLVERLAAIGISAGDTLLIVSAPGSGAMIVAKGQSRLMLGGGMSHKIFVTPLPGVQHDDKTG